MGPPVSLDTKSLLISETSLQTKSHFHLKFYKDDILNTGLCPDYDFGM